MQSWIPGSGLAGALQESVDAPGRKERHSRLHGMALHSDGERVRSIDRESDRLIGIERQIAMAEFPSPGLRSMSADSRGLRKPTPEFGGQPLARPVGTGRRIFRPASRPRLLLTASTALHRP